MSKSNPVHLWRFGRTRALFLPQKLLNRVKTGVLNGTPKFVLGPGQVVLTIHKTQLARINWKIKSIFYGLATRGPYFLKKSDAKRPFFPSCRNWPICEWNTKLILRNTGNLKLTNTRASQSRLSGQREQTLSTVWKTRKIIIWKKISLSYRLDCYHNILFF